jgi:CRISPR system Cascade subunit CasE
MDFPIRGAHVIYLSRLYLNPCSRAVRADLADCHALHRTILRAFPPTPDGVQTARDHFEVLYRVEEDCHSSGALTLLVQSAVVPDWSHLLPRYLVPAGGWQANPESKRVDQLYAGLEDGMILAFRLRANPTRKVDTHSGPNGERRNGRRVALRDEAEQLEWLRRKGSQHGFALLATSVNPDVADVRTRNSGKVTGARRPADGTAAPSGRRLTFGSVLFEGRLRVVDAATMRDALMRGIGSGKAYGFGLLSVAPPGR